MNPEPVPRVLVLLASHNGSAHIREQLASIYAQRGVRVELLIGDDASTDDTLGIIAGLGVSPVPKVERRLVPTGSAAQNFAQLFREADPSGFEYVALSDQDDIWLPDKLSRAVANLDSNNAAGYSCSVINRWPDGRESVFHQSSRTRTADFLFEGGGQGCTFVITAQLFSMARELFLTRRDIADRLIYHDWALYAIARCLDQSWIFDPEPQVIYRQHGGNDTGARHSLGGLMKRLGMFRDGKYRTQVSAVTSLVLAATRHHVQARMWKELDAGTQGLHARLRKAAFCIRHGRRRRFDSVATAAAALAGWV